MTQSSSTQGKYFEQLEVGQVYTHAVRRTVTEVDNLMFSALTINTQPLHLDEEFSKTSVAGTRMVNSAFTMGLVVGIGTSEISSGTGRKNLAFRDITFPKPVIIGDTLHVETEVIAKHESSEYQQAGIVVFEHRGYNQRGELVAKVGREVLMQKRPNAG